MRQNIGEAVKETVAKKTAKLGSTLVLGSTKADLSDLRKGAGKQMQDALQAAMVVLDEADPDLISHPEAVNSMFSAVTLYALHQQGHSSCVSGNSGETIGTALGRYRVVNRLTDPESQKRILKRMKPLLTASSFNQTVIYLQSLIGFLKNSHFEFKIDYGKLVKDLYYLQDPSHQKSILLQWTKDYYAAKPEEMDNNSEENDYDSI